VEGPAVSFPPLTTTTIATPLPLSSRPELRRSLVEGPAVSFPPLTTTTLATPLPLSSRPELRRSLVEGPAVSFPPLTTTTLATPLPLSSRPKLRRSVVEGPAVSFPPLTTTTIATPLPLSSRPKRSVVEGSAVRHAALLNLSPGTAPIGIKTRFRNAGPQKLLSNKINWRGRANPLTWKALTVRGTGK
jgi:hypothetical protein